MNNVVLDSSVLIASVFPEVLTPHAKQILKQLEHTSVKMHAPLLIRYEMVAVTRKAVYQNRITQTEGVRAREQLISYPLALHFDDDLIRRGYELAELYGRPTAYDAQYLALAERLGCEFWTADERIVNAVKLRFPHIHWLGGLKLE